MCTLDAQWNLDIMQGQGMAKYVRYNKVSLNQGSFPYILLLLGPGIFNNYSMSVRWI